MAYPTEYAVAHPSQNPASLEIPTESTTRIRVTMRVEGLGETLRSNVLQSLGVATLVNRDTPPCCNESDLPTLQRLHDRAAVDITQALEPLGYYQATVQPHLEQQGENWLIEYRIDPGGPVLVTHLEVTWTGPGSDDPQLAATLARFPLVLGDVFEHARYEKGKKALMDAALAQGYLDVSLVQHRVQVDPTQHSAEVTLILASGPHYRFGEVRFQQNALDEGLLRRYIPFTRGMPYTAAHLQELQEALTDSDYFANIALRPRLDQAQDQEVPIDVTLEPRPRRRYALGLGYGTDTGVRSNVSWEERLINRDGHRLRTDFRLSQVKDSLSAEYLIPLAQPRTDHLAFSAAYLDDRSGDTASHSLLLGVNRIKKFPSGWVRTFYLDELIESYHAGTLNNTPRLLYPGMTWLYTTNTKDLRPRHGYRVSLDLKGSPSPLVSSTRFIQTSLNGKGIATLGEGGRLLGRFDLGGTWVKGFGSLPPSLRFFAGGDNSVRGYGYRELGPQDSSGQVVGGRHLAVVSVEYEQQIRTNWSVATFYDLGNAFDSFNARLRPGVGMGVRWQSPVGPVRVDLGFALDEPGTPWRLHFNLGPDL
ncbi:translocation and assembly module TamA [Gammaproteobacteria bacterium]